MNPRTDVPFELSGWERFVLVGLTVLILGLVLLTGNPGEQANDTHGFQFTLYPWLIAGSVTISNGLDMFSGLSVGPPSDMQRLSMLLGVLLGLVVGPTLILFAWRNAMLNAEAKGSGISLLIGSMLIYALALPAIPTAILQWSAYSTLQAAQRSADERDELADAIQLILRDAKQYRILPLSEGGGRGSFSGYVLPASLPESRIAAFQVLGANDSMFVVKGAVIGNPTAAAIATLTANGSVSWKYEAY